MEEYQAVYDASGAQSLLDELPEESLGLIEQAGLDSPHYDTFSHLEAADVFESVLSALEVNGMRPLGTIGLIITIVLICALLEGMRVTLDRDDVSQTVSSIASVVILLAVLSPLAEFIKRTVSVIDSANAFEKCFIPIFLGVAALSGAENTVAGSGAFLSAAAQLSAVAVGDIIIPLTIMLTMLSCTGSVSSAVQIDSLAQSAEKNIKWMLGFCASVVVGIIGVTGIVTSAADSLSIRTAKYFVSSSVPIVGGSIGEALNSLQSGLQLLRSSVGAFGIVAAGFIFLPVLIEGAVWSFGIGLCASVAQMLGVQSASKVLRSLASGVSLILASCIFMLVLLVVSASVILVLLKGGV